MYRKNRWSRCKLNKIVCRYHNYFISQDDEDDAFENIIDLAMPLIKECKEEPPVEILDTAGGVLSSIEFATNSSPS
jgi:hypothetical protein